MLAIFGAALVGKYGAVSVQIVLDNALSPEGERMLAAVIFVILFCFIDFRRHRRSQLNRSVVLSKNKAAQSANEVAKEAFSQ